MKAVIDIETGGYSKDKNGICEIGIIIINDNNEEVAEYSTLIKPYLRSRSIAEFVGEHVSYKDDAMSINGLNVDQLLEEGKEIREVCEEIEYFLMKHGSVRQFIGQNAKAFDCKWLNYIFDRFLQPLPIDFSNVEDTMKMAKESLQLESYSLKSLCEHFNITNENSHRAVGDCRATLEVYKNLIKL
jgi:DNA polymerase III epsilon subunit-like protein